MEKEFTLYFGDIRVGTIVQTDSDFPSIFGSYRIELPEDENAVHRHIHNYIKYSIEAWRLMMIDDSEGGDWDHYQSEHEMKYIDLIESNDWRLVSGTRTIRILIPIFGTDGEVNWRLN